MRVDGRSVGDETVQRDERRDRRKDLRAANRRRPRPRRRANDLCRYRVNAPENVLPARPGNLPRSGDAASTPRLLRPALLFNNRLIVLENCSCGRLSGSACVTGAIYDLSPASAIGAAAVWAPVSEPALPRAPPGSCLVAPQQLRPRDRKPEAAILPSGNCLSSPLTWSGRVSSHEPACRSVSLVCSALRAGDWPGESIEARPSTGRRRNNRGFRFRL